MTRPGSLRTLLLAAAVLALAGCASDDDQPAPWPRPADSRALIVRLLPETVPDRAGWATDVYAAFAALQIRPTPANLCAALAVTEQESGYKADPPVPKLGEIARREIEERAEKAGVPSLVVAGALKLDAPDGRSWEQRIAAARTERELSVLFEEFIGQVPLGRRLFAGWNPVRTGGPMQVSIAFAEQHAKSKPYPYPAAAGLRQEVFTRRGGLYFGIAHLLDYPAPYERLIHRYADFNAGHYASRNAAFQNALSLASGIPLALDGDLLVPGSDKPGQTEAAARALGARLRLDADDIRSALAQGDRPGFERSALWRRVFELAEQAEGRPLPRALVPRIALSGPKISRKLSTQWFAERVEARWKRCMARADG